MAPSSHQSRTNYGSDHQPRTTKFCGSSKAQLCLQKILHTILTIPNPPPSENDVTKDILPPPPPVPLPEEEVKDPPVSPADKGLAVNVEDKESQVVKQETDNMGLLIDAAKLIFGEIKETHDQGNQSFENLNHQDFSANNQDNNNKRKNQCRTVDLCEERGSEPTVRSKRERTRILPCKYRDSVLEPLTRASRNRSNIISNKRSKLR